MPLPATTVEVRFGDAALPFGVVCCQQLPSAEAMLRCAQQTGLETAFLEPAGADGAERATAARFRLRWFSPHSEMQLCGAGTLAAALFLFYDDAPFQIDGPVAFDTAAGRLMARPEKDGKAAVRLPRYALHSFDPGPDLAATLGLDPALPALLSEPAQTVVLPLPARGHVERLRPDFAALKALRAEHLGAVIVTAPGGAAYDFVFRYFTPWHGKDESAVAGSALSLLAPYWADRLGTASLCAVQASAQQPSFSAEVDAEGVWLRAGGAVQAA